MTLTDREKPVLRALEERTRPNGELCTFFHVLAGAPKGSAEANETRRIVRQLARKGLAEFYRGLFDDDGFIAGSGYCITQKGLDILTAERDAQP